MIATLLICATAIARPVMFNTPQADAILASLEIFPPDNAWHQDVSGWPVHPNSQNIIGSIGYTKPLRYNADMAFILVPPNQKRVDVKITHYASESDIGPFPVPDNMPIEGWPTYYKHESLSDVQRDKRGRGGDRHGIIVDPVNRMLYEFFGVAQDQRRLGSRASVGLRSKNQRLAARGLDL